MHKRSSSIITIDHQELFLNNAFMPNDFKPNPGARHASGFPHGLLIDNDFVKNPGARHASGFLIFCS